MTRSSLIASLGALVALPIAAQSLLTRLDGNRIYASVPRPNFLSAQALDRLESGAPLPFAIQFSISTERTGTPLIRSTDRFIFSYDLWEEKFSVVRLGHPKRSASRLTSSAAQSWCLDSMSLPVEGLGENQRFWARVEVRAEDPRADSSDDPEGSLSLSHLIDIFSRKARAEEHRWLVEAGPLTLAALRHPGGR